MPKKKKAPPSPVTFPTITIDPSKYPVLHKYAGGTSELPEYILDGLLHDICLLNRQRLNLKKLHPSLIQFTTKNNFPASLLAIPQTSKIDYEQFHTRSTRSQWIETMLGLLVCDNSNDEAMRVMHATQDKQLPGGKECLKAIKEAKMNAVATATAATALLNVSGGGVVSGTSEQMKNEASNDAASNEEAKEESESTKLPVTNEASNDAAAPEDEPLTELQKKRRVKSLTAEWMCEYMSRMHEVEYLKVAKRAEIRAKERDEKQRKKMAKQERKRKWEQEEKEDFQAKVKRDAKILRQQQHKL